MNISKTKSVTVPELALIAATRGAIGFGAGLLLADKLKRERRKVLGWSLFLSGLASTVPIAMHVFGKKRTELTHTEARTAVLAHAARISARQCIREGLVGMIHVHSSDDATRNVVH